MYKIGMFVYFRFFRDRDNKMMIYQNDHGYNWTIDGAHTRCGVTEWVEYMTIGMPKVPKLYDFRYSLRDARRMI